MKRMTKIITFATLVILVLVVAAIALSPLIYEVMDRQSRIIQSPAGLGQVRLTKSGFGRDGPLKLSMDIKRKGDWFWTPIGSFDIYRGNPAEFQEAWWSCDGAVIVILTSHEQGASSSGHWSEDGKTYLRRESPAWKRLAIAHAFDFRTGQLIAPQSISAEAIDSASAQVKALVGDSHSTSIPVLN